MVDVETVEDTGRSCDFCGDPFERGETVAVLTNRDRVHEEGCVTAALDVDEQKPMVPQQGEPAR